LRTMMAMVTTGRLELGMSSLSGIIRAATG
jgi:hypothetical protein